MFKRFLRVVFFILFFVVVPIFVGILAQNYWGKWYYSVGAGIGTFLLFSGIMIIDEFRKAETIE